jgi:hypothetical protein
MTSSQQFESNYFDAETGRFPNSKYAKKAAQYQRKREGRSIDRAKTAIGRSTLRPPCTENLVLQSVAGSREIGSL